VIACPYLKPGTHYQVTDRWPLLMKAMVSTPLPLDAPPMDFLSGDLLLASWTGKDFQVHPGYACDGYTPVLRLCRRWVCITPTPAAGLWPAVLHDALRQFMNVTGCPWTRQQTDAWFYDALTAGGLPPHLAGIYHGAVAGPLGTAWIRLSRRRDPRLRIAPAAPLHAPCSQPATGEPVPA